MRSPRYRRRRGFTLVEVVATVAITALLAAITIPTVRGQLQTGEASALVSELENLQTAISTYKNDVGRYPNSIVYLSQLPVLASTVDGCGNALPQFQYNSYRGPYINRTIPAGTTQYVLYSGDTVLTTYQALSALNNTISINIKGVDSTVATLVDQAIDGTVNNGSGMVTWVNHGQSTELTYNIPTRTGSC